MAVVPAWLLTPVTVTSQRPMPTIPSTTPISIFSRSSVPPCSMCSSRYAAMSPRARFTDASRATSPPSSAMPSPHVFPLTARVASSFRSSCPLTARLPTSPPSSFCQIVTSSGCRVTIPDSASVRATSIAPSEPTGPS